MHVWWQHRHIIRRCLLQSFGRSVRPHIEFLAFASNRRNRKETKRKTETLFCRSSWEKPSRKKMLCDCATNDAHAIAIPTHVILLLCTYAYVGGRYMCIACFDAFSIVSLSFAAIRIRRRRLFFGLNSGGMKFAYFVIEFISLALKTF